ncbi:sulfur carrier protein ThiS [bacterium]|nr:MAG: sulfur carrier protein ThiS [bacterium]
MSVPSIQVNGEALALEREVTLGELLTLLGVPREGSAVALNDAVVSKGRIDAQPVRPGDRIEIIRAVAGG